MDNEYYFHEIVIVRTDEDGNNKFYLKTRDGDECIGSVINLCAKLYNNGTVIEVWEANNG